MKNKKNNFFLFIQYHYIHLFKEIDGKIVKCKFANGKDVLSNCVTFSYDKEDLLFLPDGDPFEIDSNSSFSDYLDFAGYHFSSSEATVEIITSIIKDGMIPNLGKNDDIYVCPQHFYYEVDENEKEDALGGNDYRYDDTILGHHIHIYSFYLLMDISKELLHDVFGDTTVLFGTPFISLYIEFDSNKISVAHVPLLEKRGVEKISSKYNLPNLPVKLLRNVKNRILTCKLFNKPLPDKPIYQNRIIDISNEQIDKMIDEIIEENAKLVTKNIKKTGKTPTFIFDFGLNPIFKKAFYKRTQTPIVIDDNDKMEFICLLLRSAVIEETLLNDPLFIAMTTKINAHIDRENDYFVYGKKKYYSLGSVGRSYFKKTGKPNLLKNQDKDKLETIISDALKGHYRL